MTRLEQVLDRQSGISHRSSTPAVQGFLAILMLFFVGVGFAERVRGSEGELTEPLAAILSVGSVAEGHEPAKAAVEKIVADPRADVFEVLAAMRGASPLAKNWLRSLASQLADNRKPSQADLLAFVENRENDPDARYMVYRWIVSNDASLNENLLASAVDDPSLPFRYLAHRRLLDLAKLAAETEQESAKKLYQQVLTNARNPEQLKSAVEELKLLGEEVNLSEQLGMFSRWYVIAPFDNTDGQGFDSPYDIEKEIVSAGRDAFDANKTYLGKSETATWQVATTEDSMGSLDLNPIFDNAKEAVCYAYCEFESQIAGAADARLGSIVANKLWVNGDLITANEIYHTGSMVDQYVGKCELRKGTNWVLVKICQNNQTESWAQDWQFQFRITDETGKPHGLKITTPE